MQDFELLPQLNKFTQMVAMVGKDGTQEEADRLCDYVIDFFRPNHWLECLDIMKTQGINCDKLKNKMAELSLY